MDSDAVHVFERAGLGRAPFRLVRIERRVGPYPVGGGVYVGSPGQPVGSCQYCGEGIAECCVIRSADGRDFIVGSVCVNKTGDAGLRSATKLALNRARAERRHQLARERIAAVYARLESDEGLRARLAAEPHPYTYRAERGETRLSWARWMLAHAGDRGGLEVVRYLEALEPAPRG